MVTNNLPSIGETFIFRPRPHSAKQSRNGELVTVLNVFTNDSDTLMCRIKFPGGGNYSAYLDELDRIVPAADKPGRTRVYVTAWDHSTLGAYSQFDWALSRPAMAERFDLITQQTDAMQGGASQGLYRRLLTGEVPDTENISEYLLNHAGRRFSSRDGWELLALTGELPEGMEDPYPDNKPEPEVYAEHRFADIAVYCVVIFDHQAGDEYIVKDNYAGAVNLYQKYLDEMHNGTVHLLALTPPLNWGQQDALSVVETMAMQSYEAADWSRWVHLNSYTRTPDEYVRMVKDGTHPIYPQK